MHTATLDRARFAAAVMPHLDAAYNLARWLTGDVAAAERVVEDACLRARRPPEGLAGRSTRVTLLAIVRHVVHVGTADGVVRRGRIRPTDPAGRHRDKTLDDAVPGSLARAITRLPLAYREVLVLREIESLRLKDIARVVDAPLATVTSRLARARDLVMRSPRTHEAASVAEPVE